LLELYLTFMGCDVATATTGVEAIAVAAAIRPQVVLMDLGLPGAVDGWEATRRFKAHPVLNELAVIAVTAHGFPADVRKAMHAGCQAVFIKPYDIAALAQEVQRLAVQQAAGSGLRASRLRRRRRGLIGGRGIDGELSVS
jgi:two-component system cell cycle response regulator